MSPSLIDRLRALGRPRTAAAIAFGRERVAVSELAREGAGWRVTRTADRLLERPLFAGLPDPQAASRLAAALGPLVSGLRSRYFPVHLALPDPVVRVVPLELDRIPPKKRQQIDFVRWRLAADCGLEVAECACQAVTAGADGEMLLALGMDARWHAAIGDALAAVDVVPWSLRSQGHSLFNAYHDTLTAGPGGLVVLTDDAWSLWLWDAHGCPRHVTAQWRDRDGAPESIAEQVERTVLAYVLQKAGRQVERLFVVAGPGEEAFRDALDARLKGDAARHLVVGDQVVWADAAGSAVGPRALAAAVAVAP